jgi:hypothetical protein
MEWAAVATAVTTKCDECEGVISGVDLEDGKFSWLVLRACDIIIVQWTFVCKKACKYYCHVLREV